MLRLAGRRLRERAHVLETVQDERAVRQRVGHVHRGALPRAAPPVEAERDERHGAEQDEQLRGQLEHRHQTGEREERGQPLEQRRRLESARHSESEEDVRLNQDLNVPFFYRKNRCV